MKLRNKLVREATNAEIKKVALSYRGGYDLTDEDCEEIRNPVGLFHAPKDETIAQAVDDFICAYEC
jgi:hypothetical protein